MVSYSPCGSPAPERSVLPSSFNTPPVLGVPVALTLAFNHGGLNDAGSNRLLDVPFWRAVVFDVPPLVLLLLQALITIASVAMPAATRKLFRLYHRTL